MSNEVTGSWVTDELIALLIDDELLALIRKDGATPTHGELVQATIDLVPDLAPFLLIWSQNLPIPVAYAKGTRRS